MRAIFLLIVLLSCAAVYAQAPDWEDFFTNTRQDVFYYDSGSIKRSDDSNVTVRIKMMNADENQKVKEHFYALEIDCRHVSYRRVGGHIGFRDGSVSRDLGSSLWTEISYDSYLDALQKIACKKTKDRFKVR